MKTVTIADVARETGLSIGTVSRVVRGLPSVRPAKVAAVKEAVARLGYQPLPPERRPGPRGPRTVGKQSGSVAVVFAQQTVKWVMNGAPVFAYVLHGIETALAQRGMSLLIHQAPDWEHSTLPVRPNDLRGVILFSQEPGGAVPPQLRNVPMVHAMGTPRHLGGDHVCPDHQMIGRIVAQYFLERGHTHCAYLGTGIEFVTNIVLGRGALFKWTIENAGGAVDLLTDPQLECMNAETQWIDENRLARQMDRLAALSPRPTALMVQADMFTPSVYRQLVERGIQPQRDLAIVTCNNEQPFLQALRPAPAVVDLQAEAIGRRAVEQLFWRVQHPHEPSMRIMIEPLLIEPEEPQTS